MRSSARRCGAACRVGVGWKRQLSSAFPPAPPAPLCLHPRPGTPPLLPLALWRVSGVPIPSDLPATFPRWWVRRLGGGCSARPHPTPCAFARGAGHDCLPPGHRSQGADPRVASRGLCGLTGGGSPPRGRVPLRRFPPLALDRSASSVVRCAGPATRRQAPPHAVRASGLAPNPRLPRLPCPVLSPSHLCRVPCPLGATLPVGAPSLCPWWWGKGAWDAGPGRDSGG